MTLRTTIGLIMSGVLLAGSAAGCERKPPHGSGAVSTADSDSAESGARAGRPSAPMAAGPQNTDVRDLKSFLDKNASSSDERSVSALPEGHPPISGASPSSSGQGLPAGHPPLAPSSAGGPGEASGGSLTYQTPKSWQSEPVASSMRKAQFLLPRAEGDGMDGQLIVYYFGRGEGGTVEANLARWKGMFKTTEGGPVPDESVNTDRFEVDGLKVTTLDVSGRYHDPMMGPTRSPDATQDARMFAAVVETPEGPWFFKAVGPVATMDRHESAFKKFVRSVEFKRAD